MLEFSSPQWQRPRAWQVAALRVAIDHLTQAAPEPVVISAIMGAGKSRIISELSSCVKLAEGQIIVISTSTERLVGDLYNDLRRRCGQYRTVGTWYGRRKRMAQIVVVCVPSMGAFAAAMHAHHKTCALWIADEVHRSECATVLAAEKSLQPAHALGLTATAFRSDLKETITLFKKVIYRYGVNDALKDGVVVPWSINHYQGTLDDVDGACIEMIRRHNGPGLANADSIADAEEFAKLLTSHGIPARAVHSKLSQYAQAKTIDELKAGALRCVVHVNMMSEGVNFPWLCWMCLRREVESRVRFCQEIGRGLRSCSDLVWGKFAKTQCEFDDPHDLFGSFDLSYAEALGEPPPKVELAFDVTQPAEAVRKISESDPVVAMAAIESAVRTIAVACETAGIMGDRKPIKKAERLAPSNALQQTMMRSELTKAREFIPDGWAVCLQAITERPDCVRFGFAADLISALNGIRAAGQWPPVDIEGRISGMLGESEPLEVEEPLMLRDGAAGQKEIDFSGYCEAVRSDAMRTWTEVVR